jgi:NADPH:quinone reductase-like Zn-dependent oxidoreductase
VAGEHHRDLLALAELIEASSVVPVVDRALPLSEASKAFQYLGSGKVRGKVVITTDETR